MKNADDWAEFPELVQTKSGPRLFFQKWKDDELRIYDVPFRAGFDSDHPPLFTFTPTKFLVGVHTLTTVEVDGRQTTAFFGQGFREQPYPLRHAVLLGKQLVRTHDCGAGGTMGPAELGGKAEAGEFWIKERVMQGGCMPKCHFEETSTALMRVVTERPDVVVHEPVCFMSTSDPTVRQDYFKESLHPEQRILLSMPGANKSFPARFHRFDREGLATKTILLDRGDMDWSIWMPTEVAILAGFRTGAYDGTWELDFYAYHLQADDTVTKQRSLVNDYFLGDLSRVRHVDGATYLIGEPRREFAARGDGWMIMRHTEGKVEWAVVPRAYREWPPDIIVLDGKVTVVSRGAPDTKLARNDKPVLLYKELVFEQTIDIGDALFP